MSPKPKPEENKADGAVQTSVANGDGLRNADAPSGVLTTATIIVRGPAKGRWRIGRHFGSEPVSIPEADLTPAQKQALAADPELMVQLVDAPH